MSEVRMFGIPRGGATRRGAFAFSGEDEKEAARLFYVAATRATQRLVMGVSEDRAGSLSVKFLATQKEIE